MARALYREWRPLTWSEVVGQEHVVRTLQNAVKAERLSHAYLFSGPRGTGKTSTARILAKAANCLEEPLAERPCNKCQACDAVNEGRYLDLIEIDAASNTSVDDVRDLRDRINFAPNQGRFKVYIVDEVHMLSTAAFNALLKTLEEPPPHAIFILATTEVHKIPATVLSRCQRHEFRRIAVEEIAKYLEEKIEENGANVEPEALALISRQATGSLRDAISLLDQLLSMGETVTLEQAQEVLGTAIDETVGELVQAIADRNASAGLELINKTIDGGIDPRQFARQVVEWLRLLLLITTGDAQGERETAQAESMGTGGILRGMHAFSEATRGERTAWQPGLALELAFMESIMAGDGKPLDGAEQNPGIKPKSRSDQVAPPETKALQAATSQPAGKQLEPAVVPTAMSDNEPAVDTKKGPSGKRNGEPSMDSEAKPAAKSENDPAMQTEKDPSSMSGNEPDTQQAPETAVEPPGSSKRADKGNSGSEFQQVLDAWPELLAAAYGRDPQAQALLNSCKPLGVDDHSLVLGFQSDLLREKMEKGRNTEIVSEALGEVLNAEMGVRCVLLKDWRREISSSPSPPMPEGGMVAAALRELGAEVTDYGPAGSDEESENQDEEER